MHNELIKKRFSLTFYGASPACATCRILDDFESHSESPECDWNTEMDHRFLLALASSVVIANAAHSATLDFYQTVTLSQFDDDVFCQTGGFNFNCSSSTRISNRVELDKFDSDLGTLTRATLYYSATAKGNFFTRAYTVAFGGFSAAIKIFNSDGSSLDRTNPFDESEIYTATVFDGDLTRERKDPFTRTVRGQQELDLTTVLATSGSNTLSFDLQLDLSAAIIAGIATCIASPVVEHPCAATARISSLQGERAFDLNSAVLRDGAFFGIRYTYDPKETLPPTVPLPSSAFLLIAGLAGLAGVRKNLSKTWHRRKVASIP